MTTEIIKKRKQLAAERYISLVNDIAHLLETHQDSDLVRDTLETLRSFNRACSLPSSDLHLCNLWSAIELGLEENVDKV